MWESLLSTVKSLDSSDDKRYSPVFMMETTSIEVRVYFYTLMAKCATFKMEGDNLKLIVGNFRIEVFTKRKKAFRFSRGKFCAVALKRNRRPYLQFKRNRRKEESVFDLTGGWEG